jgi:hypothetical protein
MGFFTLTNCNFNVFNWPGFFSLVTDKESNNKKKSYFAFKKHLDFWCRKCTVFYRIFFTGNRKQYDVSRISIK